MEMTRTQQCLCLPLLICSFKTQKIFSFKLLPLHLYILDSACNEVQCHCLPFPGAAYHCAKDPLPPKLLSFLLFQCSFISSPFLEMSISLFPPQHVAGSVDIGPEIAGDPTEDPRPLASWACQRNKTGMFDRGCCSLLLSSSTLPSFFFLNQAII